MFSSTRRAGGRALTAAIPAALIAIGVPAATGSGQTTASAATGSVGADQEAEETKQGDEQPQRSGTTRTRMSKTAARPGKVFLDSGRRARFHFELAGNRKRDLVVKVKKLSDGKTKQRWRLKDVPPGETQKVTWNGRTRRGGITGQGRHVFRVYEPGRGVTDMSQAKGRKRFRFLKHRFPIRARHSYGDGFGAGRNHQGADVFAKCGRKVLAARGGRVQYRGYHSAAGRYVVIDGRVTGKDYAYMHLQSRGRPREGARVRTGEVIGYVGRTGNASGCHLHFEVWSPPGWYEGGRALPPMKALKRWDRWS